MTPALAVHHTVFLTIALLNLFLRINVCLFPGLAALEVRHRIALFAYSRAVPLCLST